METLESFIKGLEWMAKNAPHTPLVLFATTDGDETINSTFYTPGFTTYRGYNAVEITKAEGKANDVDELLKAFRDQGTLSQPAIFWQRGEGELYIPQGVAFPKTLEEETLYIVKLKSITDLVEEDPTLVGGIISDLTGDN